MDKDYERDGVRVLAIPIARNQREEIFGEDDVPSAFTFYDGMDGEVSDEVLHDDDETLFSVDISNSEDVDVENGEIHKVEVKPKSMVPENQTLHAYAYHFG